MKVATARRTAAALALAALAGAGPAATAQEARRIRVLATSTDLAAVAREVGGSAVEVSSLMKGPEDPHFLDARPSFVRLAHDADLFLKIGLELEIGYEVPIVRDARNARIQPGTPGYCDASVGIDELEVPSGVVDRSQGDVHPYGNPHYMTDPVRAGTVAQTVAGALGRIDPPRAKEFEERAAAFGKRVDEALFGKALLEAAPARRLARMLSDGRLGEWLKARGLEDRVGGWAKEMLPFSGTKVVCYHSSFLYLLDRFHLEAAMNLEPKPGVPPSPAHVRSVVETMRATGIGLILRAVYNPRDIPDSVAKETGATVVTLSHMPGAQGGAPEYLGFVDGNVKALAGALRGSR